MRLWIKDPVACLVEDAVRGIVVEDGLIVELVGHGAEPATPADQVFDASRHVLLPGLINTHHHFYQTLTRAHPDAINKELFAWLKALYPIWSRLQPGDMRIATRLALVELMMSGCTTTSDHHYLFADGLDDAMDIQVDEAVRLGMRMMVTRGSMSMSVEDGGLAPTCVVQDHDTIMADCERVLGKYHQSGEGAMVQIALAPCSPFSVTRQSMIDSVQLAEQFDCRLHTHLGETEDENAFCTEMFGCRPVEYLEDVGWLSNRVWLAHGIHFNDDEIGKLASHNVGVCHCPTSNMMLASGHCRTCELEQAGVPVGLGVDGSASNDNSNLMEGVRHALMINRLTYGAEAVTHLDALRWATSGSARCLGRNDIGEIAVGIQADLAMFDMDELRFSGAGDPIAALVLCGAHRADRVMVAGKWTVAGGMPVAIDIGQLRHEHGQAAARFLDS